MTFSTVGVSRLSLHINVDQEDTLGKLKENTKLLEEVVLHRKEFKDSHHVLFVLKETNQETPFRAFLIEPYILEKELSPSFSIAVDTTNFIEMLFHLTLAALPQSTRQTLVAEIEQTSPQSKYIGQGTDASNSSNLTTKNLPLNHDSIASLVYILANLDAKDKSNLIKQLYLSAQILATETMLSAPQAKASNQLLLPNLFDQSQSNLKIGIIHAYASQLRSLDPTPCSMAHFTNKHLSHPISPHLLASFAIPESTPPCTPFSSLFEYALPSFTFPETSVNYGDFALDIACYLRNIYSLSVQFGDAVDLHHVHPCLLRRPKADGSGYLYSLHLTYMNVRLLQCKLDTFLQLNSNPHNLFTLLFVSGFSEKTINAASNLSDIFHLLNEDEKLLFQNTLIYLTGTLMASFALNQPQQTALSMIGSLTTYPDYFETLFKAFTSNPSATALPLPQNLAASRINFNQIFDTFFSNHSWGDFLQSNSLIPLKSNLYPFIKLPPVLDDSRTFAVPKHPLSLHPLHLPSNISPPTHDNSRTITIPGRSLTSSPSYSDKSISPPDSKTHRITLSPKRPPSSSPSCSNKSISPTESKTPRITLSPTQISQSNATASTTT